MQRVGQAALDRRRAYPGHGLEPLLCRARIDGEDRRAARDAEGVEDRLAAGVARPSTWTLAIASPSAALAAKALLVAAHTPRASGPRAASTAPPAPAASTTAPRPTLTRGAARASAARRRRAAVASAAAFRSRMRRSPPSSATSSAKSMPACAAMSGTSEVGVMPGWVLTSSSTSRPGSPSGVVVAQVGAADAAAAERAMGAQADVERLLIGALVDRRRHQMVAAAGRVFRRVVVEAGADGSRARRGHARPSPRR